MMENDEGLLLLLGIIGVLGALLLAVGFITGMAIIDARNARSQLAQERLECRAVVDEVHASLDDTARGIKDLARHRYDAINAWRVQRLAEGDKEFERILREQEIAAEQVRRLKDFKAWDQSKRGAKP